MAQELMKKEGFEYTEHKKALYFNGHERPDVVDDHQIWFLPDMTAFMQDMIHYVVGDVMTEFIQSSHFLDYSNGTFAKPRLVCCAHDEMTCQANDGMKKSWIYTGEHAIKHKGPGRGLHYSGIICSTFGWLADAGQTIEYGKNYDGYWNGAMFVQQVCPHFSERLYCNLNSLQLKEKIILTFERTHGAGHKAVFLIDNSQGHSAYPVDALQATRMNLWPGSKQAKMHDGWFICDGTKVTQSMSFSQEHPEFSNQPKGMKVILEERGLWRAGLVMKCKDACTSDTCCARCTIKSQPDFKEQQSLVQETIEAAGHYCIFLPKYHCELNFIEYFWGAVKKFIRDNCDYTFNTLKDNLPKAMASVKLETIRKWEHWTIRWCEAYRMGLGAKDAQQCVQEYSSHMYTSHRRIPETAACTFDA